MSTAADLPRISNIANDFKAMKSFDTRGRSAAVLMLGFLCGLLHRMAERTDQLS